MKLIYICNGDVSVFEAQVLELLRALQNKGLVVHLLLGCKSKSERQALESKLSNYTDIIVSWKHRYPTYPFFQHKEIKVMYNAITQIPSWESAVIHVRDGHTGYIVKQIAQRYGWKNNIIIDCRAIAKEEIRQRISSSSLLNKPRWILQFYYFSNFYKKLFCAGNVPSIKFSSVSPLINEYIRNHHPNNPYPLHYNPNIAGNQFKYDNDLRIQFRKRLGIAENELLAICSSNGSAMWQQDYKMIDHLVSMGIHVLNLSKKDYGIKSCITMSAPFKEMPGWLSAADIAILWRDDVLMNQLASPSKFSEFAAMGLYVIHNSSVYVASDYIRRTGNGVLVHTPEDFTIDMVDRAEIINNRGLRIQQGIAAFGIDNIAESYMLLYKQ